MLESLKGLIAIQSISGAEPVEGKPYGEEVAKALDYVLDLCNSFGFKTRNLNYNLGYAEIGEGKELLGVLCHLDVVPACNGWTYNPFKAEVVGGKLFGRGAIDNKGPTLAVIFAMKDILDSGIRLTKRVRIIFGCQEEYGEWADMNYYKDYEETPNYGFTPDASFPAIHGEKGIIVLRLDMPYSEAGFVSVKGGEAANMVPDYANATLQMRNGEEITLAEIGSSAHGCVPEEGENAISILMDKISKMEDAQCKFAEFYMEKIGYCLDGSKINCHLSDKESGELTFNVGIIDTNDDSVFIDVDIRCPVTHSLQEVIDRISEEIRPFGMTTSVFSQMEPVYMDKEGELIRTLMKAYKDVTGDEAYPITTGGGTYARAMKNIVAFGPAFPGSECTEHQKDEYIRIDDLYKARAIYKLAIERVINMNQV